MYTELKPHALTAGRGWDFLQTQGAFQGGKIFPCFVTFTSNCLPDCWISYILIRCPTHNLDPAIAELWCVLKLKRKVFSGQCMPSSLKTTCPIHDYLKEKNGDGKMENLPTKQEIQQPILGPFRGNTRRWGCVRKNEDGSEQ